MHRIKTIASLVTACAVVAAYTVGTGAYSLASYKWASSPVPFYVNASNADVSSSAATTAVQTGMDAWNTQGGTTFRFSYAGQVSDTSTALDGRNVVIFRNTSNPDSQSAIATTYSWSQNGSRFDSDIIVWDGQYKLFTGSSGCAYTNGQYGVYVEDILSHELGHSLGLNHSSASDATMYPTYAQCTTSFRTLASDDIAGIKALYPSSSSSSNSAPTISVTAPSSGTSVALGTSLTFTGSASDAQDGSLTGSITWSSSRDGALGTGSGFSKTLSVGSHTITARVTDNGGLSTSQQVSVTVTSSTPTSTAPSATLSVKAYKVKGVQTADLTWANLTATSVDVYRNGSKVKTTANSGKVTDNIGQKGASSYSYKVCAAGTSTCSNSASATF